MASWDYNFGNESEMNRKQMDEARKRLAKATPAPWVFLWFHSADWVVQGDYEPHEICLCGYEHDHKRDKIVVPEDVSYRDADFISHARQDLPDAIALIKKWEPLFRHTVECNGRELPTGNSRECSTCAEAREALEAFDA